MKLTATEVKQAKPQAKPYKLADGQGLFLLVTDKGQKYWRWKYRFTGKEKLLALGAYPDVSLKDARLAHQEARKKLADGIDPGEVRKVEKLTRHLVAAESFEAIAREWGSPAKQIRGPYSPHHAPTRKRPVPLSGEPPYCSHHSP